MSSSVILAFVLGVWVGTVLALVLFFLLLMEDRPHDQQ